MTSKVAISFAVITGFRMDCARTLVPNLRVVVRAAVAAIMIIGSRENRGPIIRSLNQIESHPCDSALSMMFQMSSVEPLELSQLLSPMPNLTDIVYLL